MDAISKALAIVDATLKEMFPDTFYKRCMYASSGMVALLSDQGVPAQMVGGDFICAVVSKDATQLSLQGFQSRTAGIPSHFWVETQDELIDLGPTYLVKESSFAAAPIPAFRLRLAAGIPKFVSYREHQRYAPDAVLIDAAMQSRVDDFCLRCREKLKTTICTSPLPTWEMTGPSSLLTAARNRDIWAGAALTFLKRAMVANFPNT